MRTLHEDLVDLLRAWHDGPSELDQVPVTGLYATSGEAHLAGCGHLGYRLADPRTAVHSLEELCTTGICRRCFTHLGDLASALGLKPNHLSRLEATRAAVTSDLDALSAALERGDLTGLRAAIEPLVRSRKSLRDWSYGPLSGALLGPLQVQRAALLERLRTLAVTMMPDLIDARRAELRAAAPTASASTFLPAAGHRAPAPTGPAPRVMVSANRSSTNSLTRFRGSELTELFVLAHEHPASTRDQLVLVCTATAWGVVNTLFDRVRGLEEAELSSTDTDETVTAAVLLLREGGATGAFTTLSASLEGARALG